MKKIIIILLVFSFLIPISVYAEEIDANMTKGAKSSILIEESTGKILYNKNANEPRAVASLTKMMSLILIFDVIEKGGLTYDEILTTSDNAKNMGGTQLWLEVGEKMSVHDLLKGVAMASANDAMVVLSERIGGTEEGFVKMMNKKAKEMGLKNTNFVNSTGLDEKGHISSAYDMAMIAKELLKYPDILKYTGMYESYIRENTSNKTWISNTNKLVRFYEGADGLKTGFTDDAGSCLAVTAIKNDLRLIAITLGYSDVNVRNSETMSLLDYGFNQYKATLIYRKGDIIGKTKLEKANENEVNLIISEDVKVISKKTEKEENYNYDLKINEIKYPVKKGDTLGTLLVKSNGTVIRKIPVVAEKDINKTGIVKLYFSIFKDILLGIK